MKKPLEFKHVVFAAAISLIATIGYGAYTYTYPSPVWDDMRFPPTALRINPSTSKPDYVTVIGNTRSFSFDPSSDECVTGQAQLSHKYKHGTDLLFHVHWLPDGTNTGDVVWCLEYTPLTTINGTFTTTTTDCTTDTADGIAYKHQIRGGITIDGSAINGVSSMMLFQLCRDADNPSDNLTDEAVLIEGDFHYQINTPGSAQEYIK